MERYSTYYESTCNIIRIEFYETFMINVESMFDVHEDLPSELEVYRANIGTIKSELLRDFLCECFTLTQYHSSSTLLKNHTLNSDTHFRPDVSEVSS